MPVKKDEPALAEGVRQKRRRTLPVLHLSGVVGARIADLQPYDDENHPLRLLAEHTNLSKHRRLDGTNARAADFKRMGQN